MRRLIYIVRRIKIALSPAKKMALLCKKHQTARVYRLENTHAVSLIEGGNVPIVICSTGKLFAWYLYAHNPTLLAPSLFSHSATQPLSHSSRFTA